MPGADAADHQGFDDRLGDLARRRPVHDEVCTGAAAHVRPMAVYSLMVVVGAAAFLYPFWLPATALTSQAPPRKSAKKATKTA